MARTINIGDSVFNIKCYGLKPNTRHYFFINNSLTDVSTLCKAAGKRLGESLVTDAKGDIEFDFFYEGDKDVGGTKMTEVAVGASIKFILVDTPSPTATYQQDVVSLAEGVVTVAAQSGSGESDSTGRDSTGIGGINEYGFNELSER